MASVIMKLTLYSLNGCMVSNSIMYFRESEKEPKEMERSIGRDGSRQTSKESIPSLNGRKKRKRAAKEKME